MFCKAQVSLPNLQYPLSAVLTQARKTFRGENWHSRVNQATFSSSFSTLQQVRAMKHTARHRRAKRTAENTALETCKNKLRVCASLNLPTLWFLSPLPHFSRKISLHKLKISLGGGGGNQEPNTTVTTLSHFSSVHL